MKQPDDLTNGCCLPCCFSTLWVIGACIIKSRKRSTKTSIYECKCNKVNKNVNSIAIDIYSFKRKMFCHSASASSHCVLPTFNIQSMNGDGTRGGVSDGRLGK